MEMVGNMRCRRPGAGLGFPTWLCALTGVGQVLKLAEWGLAKKQLRIPKVTF